MTHFISVLFVNLNWIIELQIFSYLIFHSSEMEEELVCSVPRQPERHRPPRVLRLTLGRRGRGWRRLRKRVQWKNQEAWQEDHPLVRVHFHPAGADGELSQRKYGSILCGDQRQDTCVCCRAEHGQGLDGDHVWHRISGTFAPLISQNAHRMLTLGKWLRRWWMCPFLSFLNVCIFKMSVFCSIYKNVFCFHFLTQKRKILNFMEKAEELLL